MTRLEDPDLVRGRRAFVADLDYTAGLHAAFVRSDLAHARIASIETGEARAQPGVVAVETGDSLDLPPFVLFPSLPTAMNQPPLARGTTRYAGEALCVVLATSAEAAADAVDLVAVQLEPLEPVVGVANSLEAPAIYPDAAGNLVYRLDDEDDDPIPSDSAAVIELTVTNNRVASSPLECEGIVASPEGTSLDIRCTTQGAHAVRQQLGDALDLPASQLRVRAPAVGGGFGGRATIPPEFVVVARLALIHQRPVRWLQSRFENLTGMVHGRDFVTHLRLGLDASGQITGLDCRVLADAGAVAHMSGLLLVSVRRQAPGLYRVPAFRWSGQAGLTNTTPVGAYRGAGQPEANHARERLLDVAARRLGIDPVELRRRNLPTEGDFPFASPGGVVYDIGNPIQVMERALELADTGRWRAEQRRRRQVGSALEIGIGMANYSQTSGRGVPSDSVMVQVRADGSVLVGCASPSHGQGHRTTWAGLVSERLGVDPSLVEVVDADSDIVADGQSTGGSRSTQVAASALVNTCGDVIELARPEAAARLEASAEDLVVAPAGYGLEAGLAVAGVPTRRVGWSELAQASSNNCLDAARNEAVPGESNPYGTHVTVVEVDVETGATSLLAHVAVDDCGAVLQPTLVEGQQHGGSAAGLGQALFEHIGYDESGNPLSATLGTYLLPAASELCNITTSTVDGFETSRNQLGTRGIGENGCNGATAAAHNAVIDALAERGVEHIDLPLTPERVWQAVTHPEWP